MRLIFKALLLLLAFSTALSASAGNYTVKKGSSIQVNCTATAPAGGWITHAFYSFTDPDDQNYLGIAYTSSDMYATFYGLKTKSKIKIEVMYAYSYRGTYDGKIHVGHGTYYDYITVTGAPDATGLSISEGSKITVKTGTSTTIHAELKPKGAEGYVTWGWLSGLGKPFCFDLQIADDGLSAIVTAKKAATAYLVAMIDNDQTTSKMIEIVASDNVETKTPESITLSPDSFELKVGKSKTLSPVFTPSDSWSELTWKSSSPKIAEVSNDGKVTGNAGGTAIITATTADGKLSAQSKVTVKDNLKDFSVPSNIDVTLGYSKPVNAKLEPANADSDLRWVSSDESVATVSSSGVVSAVGVGTCTVTVRSSSLNKDQVVKLTVKRPDNPALDHRNVRQRVKVIKSLINRTVINK